MATLAAQEGGGGRRGGGVVAGGRGVAWAVFNVEAGLEAGL